MTKPLQPWDEGYEPPPAIDYDEFVSQRGRKAGKASGEAKRQRKDTLPPDTRDPENRSGQVAHPDSKLSRHLATRTEENLTEDEKLFYQEFALQYLKDFNASMAYIRAGGSVKSANSRGPQMLRTPYAQYLIAEVMEQLEEDNLVTRKQIIMGLWREANERGEDSNPGARVRALMGLARIKKMDVQVTESKTEVTHNVMMVPAMDKDAWAQAAEDSQRQLKHDVRT